MIVIKDFFWFWKDWYQIDWTILREKRPLTEYDLDFTDIRYINNWQSEILNKLWRKLDKEHNQFFHTKIRKTSRVLKQYEYKRAFYTMEELVFLSWRNKQYIYNHLYNWEKLETFLNFKI